MTINGLTPQSFSLNSAIDSNFLTVESETSVKAVLAIMINLHSHCNLENHEEISKFKTNNVSYQIFNPTKSNHSCVLITKENRLIGIFTERDIVNLTSQNINVNLDKLKIENVIDKKPIVLQYVDNLTIFNALSLLRKHQIHYLPLVNKDGKPIGIISYESIRKALKPLNLLTPITKAEDVMTKNVITASVDDSLLTIAKLMSSHQISSIVIVEEKEEKKFPIGIITERDILQFQALELDIINTIAEIVMSSPVFTLLPHASLWDVNEMMNNYFIRRLVITNSLGELVGIVSQSNLLKLLNPTELYEVIEVLQNVIEKRTKKLKETDDSLSHEMSKRKEAENIIIGHEKLKLELEKRTQELIKVNERLQKDIEKRQKIESSLRESEMKLKKQTQELQDTLDALQKTQLKLIQSEKMSSVGQLVAGIAHEINNPVNFIYGNITYAQEYVDELLELLELYNISYPQKTVKIQEKIKDIELDFLKEDLNKLLQSMKLGSERIRDLVISLRNFSRLNEAQMKIVNIHEGLDNTLLILQNQLILKGTHRGIQVMKEYGNIPEIECYPGQLNQVFINIISNAIDSLQEAFTQNNIQSINIQGQIFNFPIILVKTEETSDKQYIIIRIIDNGKGMSKEIINNLFNPFFTTKSIGKGTGLGLSISYQIITEKHKGNLECTSSIENGTQFIIKIPKRQNQQMMWPL